MSRASSCWAAPVVAIVLSLVGCSNSPSLPISVALSPSSPQAIDQGLTLSIKAAVMNDTSSKGVTWSARGVGSVSSSTGSSITYTPPTATLASAQQVTVTATSIADPTKSASVQITVNPYLALNFPTLVNGTVGVPYSQPIAFSGGT